MKGKLSVEVAPSFYLHLSLLLIILPLPWVVSVVSAAFLHEIFHILALRIFHIEITRIELRSSGAYISTRSLTPLEQIVCASAGPLGGLLAASVLRTFPRFAFCAFVQSVYNLIPFLSFDGGKILKGICACLPEKVGDLISYTVKTLAIILLITSIVLLTFYVKVINCG